MGAFICHKKDNGFLMDDLNGIDKYYSLMSKRKADILMWLVDSKGPWETPESFVRFESSDVKKNPVQVLNEDEIRNYISKSTLTTYSDFKQTSNLCVDQKIPCRSNTTLPIINSVDSTNKLFLDCSSHW